MKDRGFWAFYDLLAIFFAGCLVLFWVCGAVALGALYRPEAQKGWPCSFAERARFLW